MRWRMTIPYGRGQPSSDNLRLQLAMGKIKAKVSLEEWLERTAMPSETREPNTIAVSSEEVPKTVPTVDENPSEVKEELETDTQVRHRARTDNEDFEWFWVFLEQANYKRL